MYYMHIILCVGNRDTFQTNETELLQIYIQLQENPNERSAYTEN